MPSCSLAPLPASPGALTLLYPLAGDVQDVLGHKLELGEVRLAEGTTPPPPAPTCDSTELMPTSAPPHSFGRNHNL